MQVGKIGNFVSASSIKGRRRLRGVVVEQNSATIKVRVLGTPAEHHELCSAPDAEVISVRALTAAEQTFVATVLLELADAAEAKRKRNHALNKKPRPQRAYIDAMTRVVPGCFEMGKHR